MGGSWFFTVRVQSRAGEGQTPHGFEFLGAVVRSRSGDRSSSWFDNLLPPCPASGNRSSGQIFLPKFLHPLQIWCKISHRKGIPGSLLPHRLPSLSPSVSHSPISVIRPVMVPLSKGGILAGKQHTVQPGWPSKLPRSPPICSFH